MNWPIALVCLILVAALALFVSGRVRMDVVALLVLANLAIAGLVTPEEALAGFASPAVVIVWAMFILSAGLTKTGVAHLIGRPLMRFSESGELPLVVALMFAASLLSALINTVTVAAILLPTTMELARRSGRSPSRLLLPLSLGCLLGGPFTAISTAPNIIASEALRSAGLAPFALLSFTPITAAIVVVGVAFVALLGRRLLPDRTAAPAAGGSEQLGRSYELEEHLFTAHVEPGSRLAGRTLARCRLRSALHLTVVAIVRRGDLLLGPGPGETLCPDDQLILHGRPDHLDRLHGRQHLQVEETDDEVEAVQRRLSIAEAEIPQGSPLVGATLARSGLRREQRVHVLAVVRGGEVADEDAARFELAAGDRLLLEGEADAIDGAAAAGWVGTPRRLGAEEVARRRIARAALLAVRVPAGSVLAEGNLEDSRLGNAFGLTVVGIGRGGELLAMPDPATPIRAGDLLLLHGTPGDLEVLQGLQELDIERQGPAQLARLESQQVGVAEVLLSPRTALAGKTLADLRFHDRYGLNVLAVWREGRPRRSSLRDLPLRFGDALLVYGHRRKLQALARDPDFLVLDPAAAEAPRLEKAPLAAALMIAVLAVALLGWLPISIAAITGAALMVLGRCLSMEEAYRAIDWRVVFLIAGMLPLGAALATSGAAELAATALTGTLAAAGSRGAVAGLFLLTVLGVQIIPPAALMVLMAPVALSTAPALGLSPHLLLMTVALGCSASFASPLSHPAQLLVMGPGGYRFRDYVKLGLPLTLLTMAVVVALLPLLWPE